MSVIQGTIIQVQLDVQLTKQDGIGTYQGFRILVNGSDGRVTDIKKPMQGLKFNPSLAASIKTLNAGDEVTIVQEKNKVGYLEIQSITKGSNDSSAALATTDRPATPSRAPNTSYAQNDEVRQKLIVRQSSLKAAVDLNPKAKPAEVLAVAEQFVDWVMEKQPPQQAAKVQNGEDFEDDIPY